MIRSWSSFLRSKRPSSQKLFSFDSILSAIALTDVFWVMAAAIMIGEKAADLLLSNPPTPVCEPRPAQTRVVE